MRLPKDLLSGNYTKPRIFLCETNKEKIAQLETTNTNGIFKFNSYSELSFEVWRFCNDIITGSKFVNPNYDKIEALRLIYLEGIGYFELQGPELVGDGIKESKSCQAYSYEYTLSQKYLEDFYVNTGEVNSIEVINASSEDNIVPVTLYNPNNTKLSLLHLVLEKDYAGWKIGHIDPQLKTLSRQFEVDRESIYDFLMNEVCKKFNCYIVFDTINNTINIYAESPTAKFIGDGTINTFTISGEPFSTVQTVSIDGYKTTKWDYSIVNGIGTLVLEDTPTAGSMIEVVGVDSTWETDVFVTFDNLSQEINVNYDADSIKTVLTVTFGDDNDIREVNLGLPYITDLSYYTTPEWMGQDLYDDWLLYQEKCNSKQSEYTKNTQDMLYYAGQIDYEENRLSLGYAEITVDENSVGTYYVRGGTYPNYYYTEVSLPAEYNASTTYYSTKTTNLEDGSDGNVAHLYEALKKYFMAADDWKEDLDALSEEFDFMGDNAITNLSSELSKVIDNRASDSTVETLLNNFLATMWNEIGRTPLKQLYYEPYKKVQITNMEAGWSQKDHNEYGNYYTVVLLLNSIEKAISERDKIIKEHEEEYKNLQSANAAISNELLMSNNFTEGQLARLNAFLREDELHLDDIVTTSQDSIADTYKNQQDALESGRIELSKLCKPQLQFSMSMANIYALPEFEPIVDQFQLGNIIKVGIRDGYIKQSRLLQVDINFDDFSDFSCEFGDLTSPSSQSDIHADLLKNAISAGKSVAQNASYWTKGSDQANSIDLRLQEGLLNSIDALKAIDGTQNAYMDKYGIHLEVVNPKTGEIGDKRVWMVNNQIVFTDDGFKTSKSVLGEFTVDGETYYGLLAQAVIAGLVEGSSIIGGTIKIGLQEDGSYAFEVHEDGSVTMNGGSSIDGYAKEEYVNNQIQDMKDNVVEEVQGNMTLIFKIYSSTVGSFDDGTDAIELQTSAMVGKQSIVGTSYTWSYYDENKKDWIVIENENENVTVLEDGPNSSIIVRKDSPYAISNIRCVMVYNDVEYVDYYSLIDEVNIYTSEIKFINCTNVFSASDSYLIAYMALYNNGDEVDGLKSDKYVLANSIEDGVISFDASATEEFSDGQYMYFIIQNDTDCYIILGQYSAATLSWKKVDDDIQINEFCYVNYIDGILEFSNTSKVVLIPKKDINKAAKLKLEVYRSYNVDDTTNEMHFYDLVSSSETTIIDLNDPVVAQIPPENPQDGQLWVDTSVTPNILKIYNGTEWINASQYSGGAIYTSRPESYSKGDLWVVDEENASICDFVDDNMEDIFNDIWNNTATYYTKNEVQINKIDFTESDYYGQIDDNNNWDFKIYTNIDPNNKPEAGVFLIPGFFPFGFNAKKDIGDSVTIYGLNDSVIASTTELRRYGSDELVKFLTTDSPTGYILYYNDQIFAYKKYDANDFFCNHVTFGEGSLLKALESSSIFNPTHWTDAEPEKTKMKNNVDQYFEFHKKTGLKLGQKDEKFYVRISSTRMSFCDNSDPNEEIQEEFIDPNEVVHISRQSATIKNAIIEESARFDCGATIEGPVKIYNANATKGFEWVVEGNSSFSLILTK